MLALESTWESLENWRFGWELAIFAFSLAVRREFLILIPELQETGYAELDNTDQRGESISNDDAPGLVCRQFGNHANVDP